MNFSTIWQLLLCWPKKSSSIMAECGHQTLIRGSITKNGQTINVTWESNGSRERRPAYCLACLEKFATNCQLCGHIILPNGLVMQAANGRIIGMCCAEMGRADATGRWTANGYKDVPYEELFQCEH